MNARAPFAAAARFGAGEIVDTGAGMGVDDAESRRLGAQVHENAHQHGVLDDIREIAGVEGVAIVHAGTPGALRMLLPICPPVAIGKVLQFGLA